MLSSYSLRSFCPKAPAGWFTAKPSVLKSFISETTVAVSYTHLDVYKRQPLGGAVTLNAGSGWSHTWNGLDVYEGGQPIAYTVREVNVPTGYEAAYSEDGFTITNTHTCLLYTSRCV